MSVFTKHSTHHGVPCRQCCISPLSIVCTLYADDMLLKLSVVSTQNMLDKFSEIAKLLSFEFTVEKSQRVATDENVDLLIWNNICESA